MLVPHGIIHSFFHIWIGLFSFDSLSRWKYSDKKVLSTLGENKICKFEWFKKPKKMKQWALKSWKYLIDLSLSKFSTKCWTRFKRSWVPNGSPPWTPAIILTFGFDLEFFRLNSMTCNFRPSTLFPMEYIVDKSG